MIRYKSSRQMTIEEFRTPFKVKLDKANRWIKLGESLPWDADVLDASTHWMVAGLPCGLYIMFITCRCDAA